MVVLATFTCWDNLMKRFSDWNLLTSNVFSEKKWILGSFATNAHNWLNDFFLLGLTSQGISHTFTRNLALHRLLGHLASRKLISQQIARVWSQNIPRVWSQNPLANWPSPTVMGYRFLATNFPRQIYWEVVHARTLEHLGSSLKTKMAMPGISIIIHHLGQTGRDSDLLASSLPDTSATFQGGSLLHSFSASPSLDVLNANLIEMWWNSSLQSHLGSWRFLESSNH